MALQHMLAQLRRQGGSLVNDLRVIVPATLAFPYPNPSPSQSSSSSSLSVSMMWERMQQQQQQQYFYPQGGLAWEGLQVDEDGDKDNMEERRDANNNEDESEPWTDALLRMAVPKKKVSHRRQRRKLVHYDCENIVHAYTCPACGKPKLRHRLCDDYERCAAAQPAKYQRPAAGGSSTGSAAAASATEERNSS